MSIPDSHFYVGWDVGGWNCDKNKSSRDALAILDAALSIVGRPWRGNLRTLINEATSAREFVEGLFLLCGADVANPAHVTLAMDTPLGFSTGFTNLITRLEHTEPVAQSSANPYLFRQTERFLFDAGLSPLSAVKDMIGSQATKGMHVLAKFAPNVESCGVWRGGDCLTAIEAYPSACTASSLIDSLRERVQGQPHDHEDKMDALTCALIAYLYMTRSEELIAPPGDTPLNEGWIWVPKDITQGAHG